MDKHNNDEKDDYIRPPDEVKRERLIDNTNYTNIYNKDIYQDLDQDQDLLEILKISEEEYILSQLQHSDYDYDYDSESKSKLINIDTNIQTETQTQTHKNTNNIDNLLNIDQPNRLQINNYIEETTPMQQSPLPSLQQPIYDCNKLNIKLNRLLTHDKTNATIYELLLSRINEYEQNATKSYKNINNHVNKNINNSSIEAIKQVIHSIRLLPEERDFLQQLLDL